jgi:hypothetical protein
MSTRKQYIMKSSINDLAIVILQSLVPSSKSEQVEASWHAACCAKRKVILGDVGLNDSVC